MIVSLCATHKRASVPLLEALTFKDWQKAMERLHAMDFVEECMILQTCNRVEVYAVVSKVSIMDAVNQLIKFWSLHAEVSHDIVLRVVEVFHGRETLEHLLLLASGLESLVVGEDQILGQIRTSYVESKKLGTVGPFLEKVFMKAVNVGRRVRAETGVNEGSVSISSVAVDLGEKSLDDLSSSVVGLVGAGEAGTLAGEELRRRGVKTVWVANRTFERGVRLAEKLGGRAIRLGEAYNHLSETDLVIVATSTPKPILTCDEVERALCNRRRASRLLIVDISQPRGVEEAVGTLSCVDLRNIDDLRAVVEENVNRRLLEAAKAREIVSEELGHLEALLKKLVAEPLVSSLCRRADGIRRRELLKALKMMKALDDKQRVVVEDLSRVLVERILQLPIEKLRLAALNGDESLLSAVEKLFNLNE